MATYTVLIVEDDPHLRDIAARGLAHPELRVEEARNGIEALALARDLRPDVVILDVRLPGMDGLEVFRVLRREAAFAACRFIVMSAHAEAGALGLVRDAGAFATIQKPYKVKQLRSTVLRAVGLEPGEAEEWTDEQKDRFVDRLRRAGADTTDRSEDTDSSPASDTDISPLPERRQDPDEERDPDEPTWSDGPDPTDRHDAPTERSGPGSPSD